MSLEVFLLLYSARIVWLDIIFSLNVWCNSPLKTSGLFVCFCFYHSYICIIIKSQLSFPHRFQFSCLPFEFTFIHIKIYLSWAFFPSSWTSVGRKILFVYGWKYLYFALSHGSSSWCWSWVDKCCEHIGFFILVLSLKSENSRLWPWLEANWIIFFLLYPVGPKLSRPAWLQMQGTERLQVLFICLFFSVW